MAVKNYTYSDITPTYNDLGLGEEVPPVLSGYDRSYDIDAIKQSLMNLFLVQKLEVPGKPAFGNPLSIKVFELFDNFSESLINETIRTMIRNYEPRVDIDDIRVVSMEELNRLIIEIDYFVIIDNRVIGDTIYMPFAHNTRSYIDIRSASYITPTPPIR